MQENELFFGMLKAKMTEQENIFKLNEQFSQTSLDNLKIAKNFYSNLSKNIGIKTAFIHGSTAKGTAGTSSSCIRKIYYMKNKFLAYGFYLDRPASDIDIIFIMDRIENKKVNTIKSILENSIRSKNVQATLNIIDIKEAINVISDASNPHALRRVLIFTPAICLDGKEEFNKLRSLAKTKENNIDKEYEIEYRTMKSIPQLMEKCHISKVIFSAKEFKKFFPLLHDECYDRIYGDFPPNRIKIKIPPIEQKETVKLSDINIEAL